MSEMEERAVKFEIDTTNVNIDNVENLIKLVHRAMVEFATSECVRLLEVIEKTIHHGSVDKWTIRANIRVLIAELKSQQKVQP